MPIKTFLPSGMTENKIPPRVRHYQGGRLGWNDDTNTYILCMPKFPCVYILASKPQGVLYIGVTGNILRRGYEHSNELYESFTKKYHVHRLVYFENHETFEEAFKRESNLKAWRRQWKVELIEKDNPEWRDLYSDIV